MHYRCVLYMLNCCVLLGLDWAEPMMLFMLHITCSCIFMHTYLQFFIFLYFDFFGAFLRVSLSPSLLLALVCSMAPKRRSTSSWNPLLSEASSSSFPSDPTPSHIRFVMIKPVRTFRRTSHNTTFIWNAKSFYRTFLILTFPLSSTVGVESHCVASQSPVLP